MGGLPVWLLALDYALGLVMWTLIGRFAMGLFLAPGSGWAFLRIFARLTDPLLRLFRSVTPGFLVAPLAPLFVAWFFYMARFYVLPPLAGYGVMGMLSFPLESTIAQLIYRLAG